MIQFDASGRSLSPISLDRADRRIVIVVLWRSDGGRCPFERSSPLHRKHGQINNPIFLLPYLQLTHSNPSNAIRVCTSSQLENANVEV